MSIVKRVAQALLGWLIGLIMLLLLPLLPVAGFYQAACGAGALGWGFTWLWLAPLYSPPAALLYVLLACLVAALWLPARSWRFLAGSVVAWISLCLASGGLVWLLALVLGATAKCTLNFGW